MFVTERAADPAFWLDLLVICAATAALIWHVRRSSTEKNYRYHIVFFLAWFLLGLAPFTHLLVPLQATVREHWAYFAAIGLVGLVVTVGYFLYCRFANRIVRAALLVLLVGI